MQTISASIKAPGVAASTAFRPNAQRLAPIIRFIQGVDPLGKEWLLTGDDEQASLLYRAFDSKGELTTAAEAVLETEYKGRSNRSLSAWNGELGRGAGASITYSFHGEAWPAWKLDIEYAGNDLARLGGAKGAIELLATIASALGPSCISVARGQYFEKQVFQDRPGVGWMLYLPQALSVQQVPDARALIPVIAKDGTSEGKQIGTIIVSVTDAPFSDENPEHVRIANAIEIRLVDQDLLPRYADL